MKKNNKKGFTIVELVIVIAVIAILAAVLIPTFSSVIKKAKVNNDIQLVRNLNTALATDTEEHKTMQDALDAAAEFGYDVAKINASATDNEILWDSVNDVFCYLNTEKNALEYIPSSVADDDKLSVGSYLLWKISDTVDPTYSTYYTGKATTFAGENAITKGFDAGTTKGITAIEYENNTDQNVVIRTNSFDTTLKVKTDYNVTHYGNLGTLIVEKVAPTSYYEYGDVRIATLKQGHLVVESGASISVISVTTSTGTSVKVDGEVTTLAAPQNLEVSGANKPEVTTVSGDIEKAIAIVRNNAVTEFPGNKITEDTILLKDYTSTSSIEVEGEVTITGNLTKFSLTIVGSGNVTLKNIYTTYISVDKEYSGTLTMDGGILDNGGRGTNDENAAIYLAAEKCKAVFKNMTIAASLTKGIKVSRAASISINNCTFDASKLSIAQAGDNSALQSLSLIDIQGIDGTTVSITNSTFKGAPQGATAVPTTVNKNGHLADSDTGAAIKLKIEGGAHWGSVTINNNTFINNYRDIVVGTAAYADLFNENKGRCPENLCDTNKINDWTISGNTTTLTEAVIKSRGVATLSHGSENIGGIHWDKYTTDVANCGELKGGVGIWVISNCYEKDKATWYYVKDGSKYSVAVATDGTITLVQQR